MSTDNQGDKLLQEALKRLESGDTSGSQDLLNQLLIQYPGHPEGLMRRGFVKMRLYDVEGALSDLEEAVTREPAMTKKFDTPELRSSVESALQQIKAVSIDPTSAQYYILMGRAYAIFARYALSLQAYTTALRIAPEEIPAGIGSASIYLKLGQTEPALQALQKMLELHPNSALLCSKVGFIYLSINSTAQAVRYLERACSLNPADWNSHLALAEVLIKQGRHEAAMARYQQTLQLEPNCSPALTGMAECCKELYRFEEAISYFQKAIAADPKDFKAMCQLGVLCIQLGGLDLGIESLHRARDLNPADVEVYSNLAKAYQQKGDLGTAAEYYAKTVSLNPRDYFAAYNLGLIHRSQGRIEDAAVAFGTAAALRPNDSQYQYQLSRAAIELGRSTEALEAARKAVALNPHNKEIQLVYARSCLFCKLYQEAIEASKTALHIDPQNLEAVLYLAQAHLELGQLNEAEEGFNNALRLAPQHNQALRGLGRVFLRQGNAQKSVDYLQQAIEADPDDPAAINDLCLLYVSGRQPERILDSVEAVLRRRNNENRLAGSFLEHWLTFLQEKGIHETGAALLEKFTERFPDQAKLLQRQARWHLTWSDTLRGRGDLSAAQQTMVRLLKNQPSNAEGLARLDELETELGRQFLPDLIGPAGSGRAEDAYSFSVGEAAQPSAPPAAVPSLQDNPTLPGDSKTEQAIDADPPSQRHSLEGISSCLNPGESSLQLSQRYLEFALQLERAGWLKEATLVLWDAYSLPECDESLQLHSHRILQNWSNRLDQEGKTVESIQVKALLGIESAPLPQPTPIAPIRRLSNEPPRALLEPPPPLDWDEPELPAVEAPAIEAEAFPPMSAPEFESQAAASPEVTPDPGSLEIAGFAETETVFHPEPSPSVVVEVTSSAPLAESSPSQNGNSEDIAAWMKSLAGDESAAPPPVTSALPSGLRSPLGAPLGAPRESAEVPPKPAEPGPSAPAPLAAGPARPAEPSPPARTAPILETEPADWRPAAPDPAPLARRPEEARTPPQGWSSASAEATASAEAASPSSPIEFEVHLTGSEDRDALVRLVRRHPEHKGVRNALYRNFLDDMAGLIRVCRDLVQDDSDEAYHVLNLARAFAHSGSDSMAILQFRKYVKLEATSEGYRELGEAYERMGKGELASQALRKAEQLLAEEELDI